MRLAEAIGMLRPRPLGSQQQQPQRMQPGQQGDQGAISQLGQILGRQQQRPNPSSPLSTAPNSPQGIRSRSGQDDRDATSLVPLGDEGEGQGY